MGHSNVASVAKISAAAREARQEVLVLAFAAADALPPELPALDGFQID